ncbi:MAG: hypothetical protein GYA24_06500 [Candidatus Lokiarchaeota archaeon]|nr:hypothetical protein [Candidatus Lokiarchaeota archaeon]
MKRTTKTILEEVILLFSSILVFRSGWTLLDRVPWLSDDAALWIMLVAGAAVMIVALYLLNKRDASEKGAPAS